MTDVWPSATPSGNRIAARASSRLAGTRLWASSHLSRAERDELDDAVVSDRTVAANTDLVREGTRADALHIIVDGWACQYTTTRDGGRQIPALLVPGDVGNLASLMFERLDYGVRTLTPTRTVALARDQALALCAQHPGIARTLTRLALVENAALGRCALSLGRRPARERLAHLFCELSVRLAADHGNASRFVFPLTQEQMADALGLTAVHVNRTLRQLRVDGIAVIENRTLTVPDMRALRQIGGFDPGYLHLDASTERPLS